MAKSRKYRVIIRTVEDNEIVSSQPTIKIAKREAKFMLQNYPVKSVFVRHTERAGVGGVFYHVEGHPEKSYDLPLREAVKAGIPAR